MPSSNAQPHTSLTPSLTSKDIAGLPELTPVTVTYRKYDGTTHWTHGAYLLGVDSFGVWVGAPAGTTVRKPSRTLHWIASWIIRFPENEGFTMNVNEQREGVPTRFYCDVTSVPVWTGDANGLTVSMIDMDLDLVVLNGGESYIDDVDEFAEHQVRYGYSADEIAACEQTAASLLRSYRAGAEPFGDHGQQLLQSFVQRVEDGEITVPATADMR